MAVAQIRVVPVVSGSLRSYVKVAVDEIRKTGLKTAVGPMATAVEGDFDEILEAAAKAHKAVMSMGPGRVLTEISIDDREAGITIEGKMTGLE
ncbi:MAG: MTH1187 family thiamine-binding protein [Terriglobia bacterium]